MKSLDALFFKFVRCGLWNKASAIDSIPSEMEWKQLFVLFRQQAVSGIFVSALENLKKEDVPEAIRIKAALSAVTLEKANAKLNKVLAEVGKIFDENGILHTVVKGPSVAQCYDKPLWRAPGDIDFFLPQQSYEKAKSLLSHFAEVVEQENNRFDHIGLLYKGIVVELHGSLSTALSWHIDKHLLKIQNKLFAEEDFRCWKHSGREMNSPNVNDDLIFLFTHFLKHFYRGGLGLRQLCDWSRFLHKFTNIIDSLYLEKQLKTMGLMSEWKVFGCFAVKYLGLPQEEMPLYDCFQEKKADLIWTFLKKSGNFGQNRYISGFSDKPYLVRKMRAFCIKTGDILMHVRIFPLHSFIFFYNFIGHGVRGVLEGR